MDIFLASNDEHKNEAECKDIETVGTDYYANKYFDIILCFSTIQVLITLNSSKR